MKIRSELELLKRWDYRSIDNLRSGKIYWNVIENRENIFENVNNSVT